MKRLAVAVAVGAVLLLAGPARAGTYDVVACSGANHSWSAYSSHPSMTARSNCPAVDSPDSGIQVTTTSGYASAVYGAGATQSFVAPADTSVVGLTYTGLIWRPGANVSGANDLAADIADIDGNQLEGCQAVDGSYCWLDHLSTPKSLTFSGRRGIKLEAACWGFGRCLGSMPWYSTEVAYSTAVVQMKSATVRVSDSKLPAATIDGGDLVAPAWVRKARSLVYSGTDNVGVRVARASFDGVENTSETLPCDYTYATPCSNADGRTMMVDTTKVADGVHTLRLDVVDPAANAATVTRTLQVDNHAPAAPTGLTVNPSSWSATNRFDVSWTNPSAQFAPIAKAHWSMCNATGSCTSGIAAGTGISSLPGLTVPSAGAWDLTVWLEDAAGNQTAANAAAPVSLRYDDTPPPAAPRITAPAGWQRSTSAMIGLDGAVSGAALGYSVASDGTDPDATVDIPVGGAWPLTDLPEGTTTLKARVIAKNGTAGAVARAIVRVDRTAPTLKLFGAGDPSVGHPGPVTVTIDATDALSGMESADDGQPVTSAAYVAYTLDGGAEMLAAGDEAKVAISGIARHALRYWAVDTAGNRSGTQQRTVVVNPPSDRFNDPGRFFWAQSTNPGATFTAATSFGTACPSSSSLTADRNATTAEEMATEAQPASTLRIASLSGVRRNSLVGFSLPSAPSCVLASARLEVTADGTSPARLSVCRAGGAWSEPTVSWETQPGCVGASVVSDAPATGAVHIDVTEEVRAIYRTGDNGFLIRSLDGSATLTARTGSNAAKRPRLIVGFEQ